MPTISIRRKFKMFHKIKNIETLPNLILKIKFENNEIKYYDMKNVIKKIKEFDILNNKNIFKNAQIDVGGYAVIWNEYLDVDCEELYVNGFSNLEN